MFFDSIIAYSLRNKLIIVLLVMVLAAWGIRALVLLPIDAVPDITNNQVQVITRAPALAATEVEQLVTAPLEQSLANLPHLTELRSISRFGLSVITVVLDEDVEVLAGRQLVAEQLKLATELMPVQASPPELAPISTGLGEVFHYSLNVAPEFQSRYMLEDLRAIQDWQIRRQLAGIPGVIEVNSFGGHVKEYEVAMDPQLLASTGISMAQVYEALASNNANTGGAYIEKEQSVYYIRTDGMVRTLDDISAIVITNLDGQPVRVKDVAQVRIGHGPRYGAMTKNGNGEVVGGIVMMLKGANSAEVIERVKARVELVQKNLPPGITIKPFLDRSKLVKAAVSTVTTNLIEGGLIVIFVLVLLLGNLRAGIVVASVIPLALLFAIGVMQATGISANLMSLGAIDFGLVVDGTVIIVERIFHELVVRQRLVPVRLTQGEMDNLVQSSAQEMRRSASFGEIIILMVYLPILALVGVEGKMFRPMAETVGLAIIGALMLSLTWVPVASALFLPKQLKQRRNWADVIMDKLGAIYAPLLATMLRHGKLVLLVVTGALIGSIMLLQTLGGDFLPKLDEGDYAIETRLMPGSSLSQTIAVSTRAEQLLRGFPEVDQVVSKIGTSAIPTDPMPMEANDLMVILKPRDQWPNPSKLREDLETEIREALEVIPGVGFEIQQPIAMRFNELMTGSKSDIAVKLYGDSLALLERWANVIAERAASVPGVASVKVEPVAAMPQISILYKREALARYGLHVQEVNQAIQMSMAGLAAGLVYENDRRFDLVARLREDKRQSMQDIQSLLIHRMDGNPVPLTELADVSMVPAPLQVSRDMAQRRVIIGISVAGRDMQSIVTDLQNKVAPTLGLPPGYYLTYGGQFQNYEEALARLQVAVPVALFLIFMLLFFTFQQSGKGNTGKALLQSGLIFTAIPLAAMGGVLALYLRGMSFSISAGVGFIALFGVAVLNGIVLIGHLNALEERGEGLLRRILEGCVHRLRPVLMTAMVASLGFLPMALSTGAGAEVQKPLATVVIGGLVTSTLLTLLVLPLLYLLVSRWLENRVGTLPGHNSLGKGAVLIILMASSQTVIAQTQLPQKPAKTISLQEAIELINKANLDVQLTELEQQQSKALQGTAWDLGRTTADLQYGRTQVSGINDYGLIVSQTIPWIGAMKQAEKTLTAQTEAMAWRKTATINQVRLVIRNIYAQLGASTLRTTQLERQGTALQKAIAVAGAKAKYGETTTLELATARARQLENSKQLQQEVSLRASLKTELGYLLSIEDTTWEPQPDTGLNVVASPLRDTALLNRNPQLQEAIQMQRLAAQQQNLERKRYMPDIRLGYANQSIEGISNQQFGSVGMGIYLWNSAIKSRQQAATIGTEIAGKRTEATNLRLRANYQQALNELERTQATLALFQSGTLTEARQTIRIASQQLSQGELDFLQWLQIVKPQWDLELEHISLRLQRTQANHQLLFLLGQ